jgi:hypothetical protein
LGSCHRATYSSSREEILDNIYKNQDSLVLCQGEIDLEISQKSSVIFPINNHQNFVQILCFSGAYQNNYQYILHTYKRGNIFLEPLPLESFEIDEKGKIRQKINPVIAGLGEYNIEEKTLTLTTKYRGLGDCGSLGKYQLIKDKFKLQEYRIKSNCDGQYLEPQQYTKVYP